MLLLQFQHWAKICKLQGKCRRRRRHRGAVPNAETICINGASKTYNWVHLNALNGTEHLECVPTYFRVSHNCFGHESQKEAVLVGYFLESFEHFKVLRKDICFTFKVIQRSIRARGEPEVGEEAGKSRVSRLPAETCCFIHLHSSSFIFISVLRQGLTASTWRARAMHSVEGRSP